MTRSSMCRQGEDGCENVLLYRRPSAGHIRKPSPREMNGRAVYQGGSADVLLDMSDVRDLISWISTRRRGHDSGGIMGLSARRPKLYFTAEKEGPGV